VDRFTQLWTARTATTPRHAMSLGLYKLDKVSFPAQPPGALCAAAASDIDILAPWIQAFTHEIGDPADDCRAFAARNIAEQRIFLWQTPAGPVSMAAWTRPTPNGVAINLV